MLYSSEKRDITMALAGDVMVTRRLSVFSEERFVQFRELLRSADVAFANFESTARHYHEGSPSLTAGTFMTTEPKLLEDIRWMGFNLLSCANNHAFDYGEQGILDTIRHLEASGFVHAGTGRNLREARSPAYLDTPGGRVALIAATSFFREWNQAGEQRPDSAGRPGVNPLGFRKSYSVDSQAMADLRRIGVGLGLELDRERLRSFGFASRAEVGVDTEQEYQFLGQKFVVGDGFGVQTKANEKDAAGNLAQLREARRQADWVIVSLHYHEMGGASLLTAGKRTALDECAAFFADFSHRCIDEGADVVVGHGPHISLGVEIYKGKPIFHGLGNFILENETVRFIPDHSYSRFGLGSEATPADFLDARSDKDTRAHPADPLYWQAILATCKIASGKLKQVALYPVDLGFRRPRPQRGRPLLAEGQTAEEIIARMARLSRKLGTDIVYRAPAGVIELD
ncbi:MAG: CapA family protein [Chloroflexi bacterium]|nr:CapA family protein [Chloroflexota bacterium]